jgi:hypothetical protein
MREIQEGDIVKSSYHSISVGIVDKVFTEDGDRYVKVRYKYGGVIVRDEYTLEDFTLYDTLPTFEAEITGLGCGRHVFRTNANTEEEAVCWFNKFLKGDVTDVLGRRILEIVKVSSKTDTSSLIITYIKAI